MSWIFDHSRFPESVRSKLTVVLRDTINVCLDRGKRKGARVAINFPMTLVT